MNDFVSFVIRWTVRIVMLVAGAIFFASVLFAGCVLAMAWAFRALWAKLTGQPVNPWVMPLRASTSWGKMYQRTGGFAAAATATQEQESPPPFTPPEGSKRSGILPKVARDVSDVQPREVHDR